MKIDSMRLFRFVSKGMLQIGIVVFLLILCTSVASADEPDAVAREEIAHLFSYLGSSGCQFYRNGSWHISTDAVSHLHKKYEHVLKKRRISTAESFIELAATASSTSGKPYLVKCGEAPTVESAAWFMQELTRYRAASK